MTYIDQIRLELSFLDHTDVELWVPVSKYLYETLGDCGYPVWREWTDRCDMDVALANLEASEKMLDTLL